MLPTIRIDSRGRAVPPPEDWIRTREDKMAGSTGWVFSNGEWRHSGIDAYLQKSPPTTWELSTGKYFVGAEPARQEAIKKDLFATMQNAGGGSLQKKAVTLGLVAMAAVWLAKRTGVFVGSEPPEAEPGTLTVDDRIRLLEARTDSFLKNYHG